VELTVILLALDAVLVAIAFGWWLRYRTRHAQAVERALTETLHRYESIVNLSADAIITIDERQNIVTFNRGAEAIFGWQAREILGQSLNTLIPGRFRDVHERHVQAFGRAGEVARRMGERRQVFGLRRDGSEFPADASIARLDLPSGRLFSVVLRDATDQVRRETHGRLISQAGATLASSLDYESTLQSIVHVPVPLVADCAVLDVVEPDGGLRRVASTHDDDAATKKLRELNVRLAVANNDPFPSARILARSTPFEETDAMAWAADDRAGAVLREIGAQRCLTLPLRARDRVVGLLHLISTDPRRSFDDAARELAQQLAFRAALTLENVSLYRAAQRATRMRDEIVSVARPAQSAERHLHVQQCAREQPAG
jgi:PAS domain S-box-containing protein